MSSLCGARHAPRAELPSSPSWDPTCRPCPSTVVELNLKPWLSSGLVLAGESLSDLRQWDCLSFGEQRCGCAHRPKKAVQGEAGQPWPCPAGSLPPGGEEGAPTRTTGQM